MMATREQLKALAQLRLREAEALFDAGLYDGCAYLCGYVVEVALKARICATLGVEEYPERVHDRRSRLMDAFRTHDFDELKLLAGMRNDPLASTPSFLTNWSIATRWKPEQRYEPQGTYDRDAAEEILNAIRVKPDGVLPWLSSRW
jgi:HEPN domain-containing protein